MPTPNINCHPGSAVPSNLGSLITSAALKGLDVLPTEIPALTCWATIMLPSGLISSAHNLSRDSIVERPPLISLFSLKRSKSPAAHFFNDS